MMGRMAAERHPSASRMVVGENAPSKRPSMSWVTMVDLAKQVFQATGSMRAVRWFCAQAVAT